MKHKYIVAGGVVILALIFIALCIGLATPANAYEGERITTARQDALHRAADSLRMAGLSEDDPAIRALSAEWWRDQEAMDIIATRDISAARHTSVGAFRGWRDG